MPITEYNEAFSNCKHAINQFRKNTESSMSKLAEEYAGQNDPYAWHLKLLAEAEALLTTCSVIKKSKIPLYSQTDAINLATEALKNPCKETFANCMSYVQKNFCNTPTHSSSKKNPFEKLMLILGQLIFKFILSQPPQMLTAQEFMLDYPHAFEELDNFCDQTLNFLGLGARVNKHQQAMQERQVQLHEKFTLFSKLGETLPDSTENTALSNNEKNATPRSSK